MSHAHSKNAGNIIFSYLSINSIHKFKNLRELVTDSVEILYISETKLDLLFPNLQFLIPGFYKPLKMNVSSLREEL